MGTIRVLVVEDDSAIALQICQGLSSRGYTTNLAATGQAAFDACASAEFDAIVLDRMLPDTHGVALLGRLRCAGHAPAVLMLSALGSVEDRVEGLEAGADDYLAKPFDMSELNARLMAICRRGARPAVEDGNDLGGIAVGRLRLDAASHRVTFGKDGVELNRKQFSLMAFLMRHANRVVTRAMLLEHVWGYTFDPATNIVESNLSRLRTRLQTLGCDPIETRRGEGYSLRADQCR